jgi:hypothetical protein
VRRFTLNNIKKTEFEATEMADFQSLSVVLGFAFVFYF